MDFGTIQAAVAQGQVDMGISGFAYSDDRAKSMLLSDYYGADSTGQGLLVLAADQSQYTQASDFDGKTVGAQNGSLQYKLVQQQLPNAVIQPITNLNDAILLLQAGKIDALAVSEDNGNAFVGNYPTVAMSSFMFDYSDQGMVVACQLGQTDLMNAINAILKDVNAQGLYTQWRTDAIAQAASLGIQN